MRFSFIFICLSLLVSCQGDSEIKEVVTGDLMEFEPSQLELDEIALVEQPQTVQDFFAVDNNMIGDDFCYNYTSISQLILYGNDTNEEWKQFEVSDNYLTAYHKECDVLLEFMTFELGGEKKAFLSQMSQSKQQFDYLKWNSKTERWNKTSRYPQPSMGDYFKNLDWEATELVYEYGSENIYINPKSESVTYEFSEWAMLMNMGEKQQLEFSEKPDYHFELKTAEDQLELIRVPIFSETQSNQAFLVAYSVLESPRPTFKSNYENLLSALKIENLQHQLLMQNADNFEAYFPSDTFDLSATHKIDPTDGFWLFQKGKEPLVLRGSEDIALTVFRASEYFKSEVE
ncbi:MAG: hypothetical protein ACI8ZM_001162 [Crocinitomix sp.]|jgi:hypothetical protein